LLARRVVYPHGSLLIRDDGIPLLEGMVSCQPINMPWQLSGIPDAVNRYWRTGLDVPFDFRLVPARRVSG
jgi:hypothetical protein